MKMTYRHTLYASYLGYITQAIINNLPPLLFLTFQNQFGISFDKIGLLISMNFGIQIVVDLISAKFIDKIGYRIPVVAAHLFCIMGLVAMGILPFHMDPFAGLMIGITLNAIGGGLIEVLISPIVESLPGDEKAGAMSLLHSFYSWGHVAVVLLSTLFFQIGGISNWSLLPIIWAIVPLFNALLFLRVPLRNLVEEGQGTPTHTLLGSGIFWMLFLLMVCSGASEQAMSQWSSLFAEAGLGVSKTMGDLLGPCAFALLMGTARLIYGICGSRIPLPKVLAASGILCVFSYMLAVFSPVPLLSLLGCALCGLSVGIMWPGTFSLAAAKYPGGGTAMFALLALAGDIGCSSGPGLVGLVSNAAGSLSSNPLARLFVDQAQEQAALKTGLFCAIVFPILMVFGIVLLQKRREHKPDLSAQSIGADEKKPAYESSTASSHL